MFCVVLFRWKIHVFCYVSSWSEWAIYDSFLTLLLHALLVLSCLNYWFLAFCQLQMMAGFHPRQREQRQDRVIHKRWVVAGPVLSIPPGLSPWGHRFLTKNNWLVSCKEDLLQPWVISALCATRECCTSQSGMLQSEVEGGEQRFVDCLD